MDTMATIKYRGKACRTAPALLADIRRGRFGFDCALPNEDTLADMYGVSRSTVRRMIAILSQSGTISRKPHKGIWIDRNMVASPVEKYRGNIISVMEKTVDGSGEDRSKWPVCAIIQTDACLDDVMPQSRDFMMLRYLKGINEEIREKRSSLVVHHVPMKDYHRAFAPDTLPSIFRDGRVAGAILINNYEEDDVRRFAEQIPCVSLSYEYNVPRMDFVRINPIRAILELMQYLYQRGHRKVAFAGEIVKHCWCKARLAGYIEAVMGLGLEMCTENIFDFSNRREESEIFGRLRQRVADGVTAVVCGNDEMGYELAERFREVGLEVPRDVSLTGVCSITPPGKDLRLTSMKFPGEEMGITAVRMLLERCCRPTTPVRHLLLDSTMVEGDSVANVNR